MDTCVHTPVQMQTQIHLHTIHTYNAHRHAYNACTQKCMYTCTQTHTHTHSPVPLWIPGTAHPLQPPFPPSKDSPQGMFLANARALVCWRLPYPQQSASLVTVAADKQLSFLLEVWAQAGGSLCLPAGLQGLLWTDREYGVPTVRGSFCLAEAKCLTQGGSWSEMLGLAPGLVSPTTCVWCGLCHCSLDAPEDRC